MPALRAVAAALATSLSVITFGLAVPASGAPNPASALAAAAPGAFHALPAHRLLDTRTGLGGPKAAVAAGGSVSVQVTGREGVPADGVGAVALTVTAVTPTGPGFVTAYASGTPVPTASSLNYAKGDIAANLVVTRLSPDGRVDLRVGGSGSTHLLAEVVGWVEAGAAVEPGTYSALEPVRLLDTRNGTGAPQAILPGGTTLTLRVAGRGGVPSTGAGAVVLNLTAVGGTAQGYLTVGPTLVGPMTTSNLNYATGQVRANLVVVPLSEAGSVDLRVTSTGSVHAVADVVGWVRSGAPAAGGAMAAVAPARLLDTRVDGDGPLGNLSRTAVQATGRAGVPASNIHAVLLNVTATQATAQGRVSILPTAANLPTGSQLQSTKGRNDANLVLAPVSPSGSVDLLFQGSGTVHLVVDVVGYVTGPPVDTGAPGPVTSVVTSATKSSVTLTWQNPPDADLSGVTIRRVVGSGVGSPYAGTLVAETTGTSFTDTNLVPGTSYGYSVWAHDSFPNISKPFTAVVQTAPLTWSPPTRVAPVVGVPTTVSCPSATWCMAGDASGQYLTWNGSAWSAPKRAVLIGDVDDDQSFGSLTCPSSSFCAAAAGTGGLVTYRSGTWGAVTYIQPPSGATMQSWDVDCTSASFCMAVGEDLAAANWATRWNGTTWSTPVKVSSWLSKVDCVSTSFCMAVGSDHSSLGWATRWNGSTWSATKIEPSAHGVYDVSCPTTSFCMATGSAGRYMRWNGTSWTAPSSLLTSLSTSFDGYAVSCTSTTYCVGLDPTNGYTRWNGSSWSRPTRISYPGSGNFALSCASSTCIAVDALGRYGRYNGTSWTPLASFDPTRGRLVDLSCPSETSCLAADQRGEAYRFNGTSWSSPVSISWVGGRVSCATASWCLAIAPDQNAYRVLSGSTWSALATAPAALEDVECPAAGWCVGFDASGRSTVFNGTSWSTPAAVYSAGSGIRLDCVGKTFCLAVSTDGNRWSRWNGSTWSPPAVVSAKSPWGGPVSCATKTMCVSADWDGNSFLFNGTSWRTITLGSMSTQGAIDISCPTTTSCRVLDAWGRVGVFTGTGWKAEQEFTGLYMEDGRPTDDPSSIECPSVYLCVVTGRSKVVTLR